jgi:hypothetical protein
MVQSNNPVSNFLNFTDLNPEPGHILIISTHLPDCTIVIRT